MLPDGGDVAQCQSKWPCSSETTMGSPTMSCESIKENLAGGFSLMNVYEKRFILGLRRSSCADPLG